MKATITAFFIFLQIYLIAQISGDINYKELGIQFTIPPGWVGQESGEALIMGSQTEPGLILMIQHEFSTVGEIKKEAEAGIQDQGVSLKRSSEFEVFEQHGIGAEFSGIIQNQPAKAYVLALINSNGKGLTIMAATESSKYSERYKQLSLLIAKSVRFSTQEATPASPLVGQWKNELKNKRLAYIKSSSSTIGGYTGTSEKEEIWLCGSGYFEYNSSSHNTFDTSGAMGYSNGKEKGAGSWDILPGANGQPYIQLRFQNGAVKSYEIQGVENRKLYLSGYGYFWSDAGNICY